MKVYVRKVQFRRSTRSWVVGWEIHAEGVDKPINRSRSFDNEDAADTLRAKLRAAAKDPATEWDLTSGLPFEDSEGGGEIPTAFVHIKDWVFRNARRAEDPWEATTLRSGVESAEAAVRALLRTGAPARTLGQERQLRMFLVEALTPGREEYSAKPEHDWAREFLDRWSLPIDKVTVKIAETTLDEMTTKLHRQTWLDATPDEAIDAQLVPAARGFVGKNVRTRRKTILYGILKRAVALGYLVANPLDASDWKPKGTAASKPNRDLVLSMNEIRVLAMVTCTISSAARRMACYFLVMGFAGLRPGEASRLRRRDLILPATGWGTIIVRGSTSTPGKRWTGTEDTFVDKTTKTGTGVDGGDEDETPREVPIPPELVGYLRSHLELFVSTDPTRRVFTNSAGQPVNPANMNRVWRKACHRTFPESDPRREITPYYGRHSAASLFLNAGVPIPVAASWLGHSPEVFMRIYAGFTSDDQTVAKERVEAALSGR